MNIEAAANTQHSALPYHHHKIAIAVHVYYQDLWPEIASYLQNINYPYDLFITTTDEQFTDVCALVKQHFPLAYIRALPNRGMDILPFLSLMPELTEAGYVAVCKLHTKQGHDELAGSWRKLMLDTLVGNTATIAAVTQALADDGQLAMVGPGALYLSVQKLMYAQNQDNIELLARAVGISSLPQDWGFFAGTMFWVRPALFRTLAEQIRHVFEGDAVQKHADGGLEHALERLIGLLPVSSQQKLALLLPGTGLHKRVVLQKKVSPQTISQTYTKDVLQQYQRLTTDRARLIQSGLFDNAAYIQQCPELLGCAADLPSHYLLVGRFQQATPHPDFDPRFYTQQYGAHFVAGESPFLHYLREGAKAGCLLRPSKQQEMEEIPNFRYRVLNTALIDWSEQKRKRRNDDLVSIIIPVFNQGQLTQECIESLYQHTAAERFELIVVDNGSDAETLNILKQLAAKHSNMRIVRNEENLNFALGCNLGFAASQGSKVIFLNNDTTVTANWLTPLLEALDLPDVSAAQPRLLYPDGTIQCMGVVFSEKSPLGYPIYAGMKPEESWAGRSRSFQAVTGACMAIKAEDYVKVSGFDPRYINGQEDIDICLRINLGNTKHSWYVPLSTVFHHESRTPNRVQFIQHNRAIFIRHWKSKIKADDQQHYHQDNFIIESYHPDLADQAISAWRPHLKNIQPAELECPENLEPYYFDKIKESCLFDSSWYLKQYRSKFNINGNPLTHYLKFSIQEKLNPSPNFDTCYYIESNPDITESELHPFIHYVLQGYSENRKALPPPPPEYTSKYITSIPQYVPRLPVNTPPVEKAVRVIAFYLPQFHTIPENDKWWGNGFTEWTNVRPAQPQFEGHYQPHVPDDFLGYYNLLDRQTQAKQIELAKQYGIEGFCFYLYWFTGHKLLEQPVDNYLADPSLNLPFCVCWANENWSRRWDGLENDLLMEQHYSDEDDINFIANAAKYLRDPRYICINGRPLLLVYRPNLFPSMQATAYRWRTWCRNNDIGEIYLAYPQSFECIDPAEYGFDAAIEFPPNNSNPPNITHQINPINANFQSNVYDWRIFIERCENYQKVNYKLFRSTTPSWDNTARKKNKGSILHNSCPKLFKRWLSSAMIHTYTSYDRYDDRIIFVNAWNEWAEGAHLEPDKRYGYAWLQAVLEAHQVTLNALSSKCAIVIHAYYIDVFEEIIERLSWINLNIQFFISTTQENEAYIHSIMFKKKYSFTIYVNENKGRDVLPFIKMLPDLFSKKIDYFIKIHTKKSPHRCDGDQWRNELFSTLLSKNFFLYTLISFLNSEKIQMSAPSTQIVPINYYWGNNEKNVINLCDKLNINTTNLCSYKFVAGTMFMAKLEIFTLIKDLYLHEEKALDFELEAGQTDGTLAHALERLFGILVYEKNNEILAYGINNQESFKYAEKG